MHRDSDQLLRSLLTRRQVFAGLLWDETLASKVGCGEIASLTEPELVLTASRGLLAAGADAISTNTFGATPGVMELNGLGSNLAELAFDVNFQSALLAREAAREFSLPSKPRWVLGSIGPTLHALTIMGGGEDRAAQIRREYYHQARALWQGGVDILHIERAQDVQNVRAALGAIRELQEETPEWIPVMLTAELERTGRMLDQTAAAEIPDVVQNPELLAIGITGPAVTLMSALPDLLNHSKGSLAALPDTYQMCTPEPWVETPESLTQHVTQICFEERIRIVGVGLGARPAFIKAVRDVVSRLG